MGLILTKPATIGDHRRMPGYELTEDDMIGRNINAMERQGYVTYVDDPPARQRSHRAAHHDKDDD